MRRFVAVSVMVGLLWASGGDTADAQDNTLPDVLVDAFYGGAIGALVGTAVMALTAHPKDHVSYILTGAAIGVIGGTVYGVSRSAYRSMAELEEGRLTWRIPTIIAGLEPDPSGRRGARYSAEIFRYRF